MKKRMLSVLLTLVLLVSLLSTVAVADDTNPFRIERTGQSYATLAKATCAAQDGDVILVCRDATISTIAYVKDNKTLTIKSDGGEARTLSRDPAYAGDENFLLDISQSSAVQLENLIFDGGAPNFAPNPGEPGTGLQNIPIVNDEADVQARSAMIVSSGTLSAKNVVFQNAYSSNYRGGAVLVKRGTVEMTGCTF